MPTWHHSRMTTANAHHPLVHHVVALTRRCAPLILHVVVVRLRVVNRQVLNPVLLLLGHIMVHMCALGQRDNRLLD